MKRADRVRRLVDEGCVLSRHGARHDVYCNVITGASEPVPRHREIGEMLARHIIRRLSSRLFRSSSFSLDKSAFPSVNSLSSRSASSWEVALKSLAKSLACGFESRLRHQSRTPPLLITRRCRLDRSRHRPS